MNKNERSNQNYTIPKTPNQIRSIRFPEQLTTYRKCIKQKHFRAWWLYISTSRRGHSPSTIQKHKTKYWRWTPQQKQFKTGTRQQKERKGKWLFPFSFFFGSPLVSLLSVLLTCYCKSSTRQLKTQVQSWKLPKNYATKRAITETKGWKLNSQNRTEFFKHYVTNGILN